MRSKMIGCLQHTLNKTIHEVLAVACLTTLAEAFALLGLTTLCWTQLEWPQEVVRLAEVRSHSEDLVNEVLHAHDAVLAKPTLHNSVIVEGQTLLVDLAKSTLVDQVTHRLERRVTIREVWFHTRQHLCGSLRGLHEDTHVHLEQTHDRQDLLGLGVHVSETADADHEQDFGLGIHKVVACSLPMTMHTHTLLCESTVLLHILISIFVC